jgi:hypothetical protein
MFIPTQEVCNDPKGYMAVSAKVQVRSHNSPCGIYGGQGGRFGKAVLEKDEEVLLD